MQRGKMKQRRKQGGGLTENRQCYMYTSVHIYLTYVICEYFAMCLGYK
jgi:hypothetical protein